MVGVTAEQAALQQVMVEEAQAVPEDILATAVTVVQVAQQALAM